MKEPRLPVTPALLVCAGFPVLFLLSPDGIPCVYANCVTEPFAGSVSGLTVLSCQVCSANQGQVDEITVWNCSASKSLDTCEINGSVTVTITGTCDALWRVTCGGAPGAGGLALQGPATAQAINYILSSDNDGDFMFIELIPATNQPGRQNCACTPNSGGYGDAVFSAAGNCNRAR